mmetsp:Transcript_27901/g.59063  ORF Transcript_27901/g.59063 Transcript_27901/m.59063 type:complete len:200 (-) Transcript_27901:3-602(-)
MRVRIASLEEDIQELLIGKFAGVVLDAHGFGVAVTLTHTAISRVSRGAASVAGCGADNARQGVEIGLWTPESPHCEGGHRRSPNSGLGKVRLMTTWRSHLRSGDCGLRGLIALTGVLFTCNSRPWTAPHRRRRGQATALREWPAPCCRCHGRSGGAIEVAVRSQALLGRVLEVVEVEAHGAPSGPEAAPRPYPSPQKHA